MVESVAKGYKPWLILCVVVLVGSLGLLTIAVAGWFLSFGTAALPLWVTIVGVLAVLGFLAGVAGLLGILGVAAMRAAREDRRKAMTPTSPAVDAMAPSTDSPASGDSL